MNLPLSTFFVFLILSVPPAFAQIQETNCGPLDKEVDAKDIPCLVDELIDRDFPELKAARADGRITYDKFNSEDTFLKTSIVSGFLKCSERRVYAIDINPAMYRTFLPVLPRPTLQAVQGALVHELIHLRDYETSSSLGLAKLAKDHAVDKADYERETDERAFEMGYAIGIELYRDWLYTRLDEKAVEYKRRVYYTPDEIHQWVMTNYWARPEH